MISSVKQLLLKNRDLIRFLSSAFLLLLLWILTTTFFPSIIAKAHFHIIEPQAKISAIALNKLGFENELKVLEPDCEARIFLKNQSSICISTGCSGLELFFLFLGFILLMRGRPIDKLWFMPLGIFGILLLNIIRIIALSIIYYYKPEYLQFNHKYTFVLIIYGAIFALWVLWINKFSNKKPAT